MEANGAGNSGGVLRNKGGPQSKKSSGLVTTDIECDDSGGDDSGDDDDDRRERGVDTAENGALSRPNAAGEVGRWAGGDAEHSRENHGGRGQLEEALRAGCMIRAREEQAENAALAAAVKGFGRLELERAEPAAGQAVMMGGKVGVGKTIHMTKSTADRARSIAERRQRQDTHNARRRVMYVADKSGENGSGLGGMVGRCMSVQQQTAGHHDSQHAAPGSQDLNRGAPAQVNFSGMGMPPRDVRVAKPVAYQMYPTAKVEVQAPPRLKSSHAVHRRRRLGGGSINTGLNHGHGGGGHPLNHSGGGGKSSSPKGGASEILSAFAQKTLGQMHASQVERPQMWSQGGEE